MKNTYIHTYIKTIDQYFANSLPQTHSTLSELKDRAEGGTGSKVHSPSYEILGKKNQTAGHVGPVRNCLETKLCSLLFLHCGITAPGWGRRRGPTTSITRCECDAEKSSDPDGNMRGHCEDHGGTYPSRSPLLSLPHQSIILSPRFTRKRWSLSLDDTSMS